jgi:hypothetical protein
MVIDLLGLTEKDVRTRFPEVYQYLLSKVKPNREKKGFQNNYASWHL